MFVPLAVWGRELGFGTFNLQISYQKAIAALINTATLAKYSACAGLGPAATISAVLYANTNHPEWKTEFPNWVDRCKQILKKWRALPSEQKAPYLQRARDNRSAIRMKKAQQVRCVACPVCCVLTQLTYHLSLIVKTCLACGVSRTGASLSIDILYHEAVVLL